MTARFAFNAQLRPPAPFVLVTVRDPVGGAEVRDLPARIDTAADRTLLPQTIAQALGLFAIGSLPIGGVGGSVERLPLYAITLSIHSLAEHTLEVVAHPDEDWILLGRDVLNAYRIVFDGPGSALQIEA